MWFKDWTALSTDLSALFDWCAWLYLALSSAKWIITVIWRSFKISFEWNIDYWGQVKFCLRLPSCLLWQSGFRLQSTAAKVLAAATFAGFPSHSAMLQEIASHINQCAQSRGKAFSYFAWTTIFTTCGNCMRYCCGPQCSWLTHARTRQLVRQHSARPWDS